MGPTARLNQTYMGRPGGEPLSGEPESPFLSPSERPWLYFLSSAGRTLNYGARNQFSITNEE